ncbi:XdhC family protein [Herbiconiux solani]|uniref:XdhC family protein n=1 Tax=Herbiconiux solani TaxID=661329 RepID=UPI0009FE0833|nr:XdhC/CoxI family protein [Herbiconiux solani]
MLELADALLGSLASGRRLAVATVVAVDGSAPRALGTSMAVDDQGRVIGSISGGCVEGAVYDACTRVLDTGVGEVCEFGFTDADAFEVGLACGGRLRVFVQELGLPGARSEVAQGVLEELRRARDGRAAGIAVVLGADAGGAAGLRLVTAHADAAGEQGAIGEPDTAVEQGAAGGPDAVNARDATGEPDAVGRRVSEELRASIHAGRSVHRRVDCDGRVVEAVMLVSAPPPRLIVFGAVDFSAALSRAGAVLGYRVTVCDARPVFATADRFPDAEVVNRWPSDYLAETEVDERTVVCILTHDDKFDIPLLETALALPVAYVGAMGSRTTHERRLAALRERGIDEAALASLHSPIGLDLGASTPEETAVSILAEVLMARNAASAAPLRATSGAIHPRAAAAAATPAAAAPPAPSATLSATAAATDTAPASAAASTAVPMTAASTREESR